MSLTTRSAKRTAQAEDMKNKNRPVELQRSAGRFCFVGSRVGSRRKLFTRRGQNCDEAGQRRDPDPELSPAILSRLP